MLIFRVAAAVAVACSTPAFADGHLDKTGWPESFTVGTASQGGTYFAYGSGWANLVAEELGLSGGGEVTGGPMQNMALVHTGDAAFGMTTMGPAAESLAGTNPIAPGLQMNTYIAQVSSSVAGKSTDLLMRPLSHEFFCALALSAAKKHLNSVEMSPVRMPWRQDGRVFWNAGQTCPAAFVLFFFDEVWFSSGRRSRAYRW